MEMIKIGRFLQELRREKGMTQEELSEKVGVARRTVSRWETGSNMPDLDILIELADLYEVDLREIFNGERKSEQMNEELKDTVLQVAEYSNEEKRRAAKISLAYFTAGIVALIIRAVMDLLEMGGTFWTGFLKGAAFGTTLIAMLLGVLYTTGRLEKVIAFKMRLIRKEKSAAK